MKIAQRFAVENRSAVINRAMAAKNQAPSVDALCSQK